MTFQADLKKQRKTFSVIQAAEEKLMNYPAASYGVSIGGNRSRGEASFEEYKPPLGDSNNPATHHRGKNR
jgi:hypothetical protein